MEERKAAQSPSRRVAAADRVRTRWWGRKWLKPGWRPGYNAREFKRKFTTCISHTRRQHSGGRLIYDIYISCPNFRLASKRLIELTIICENFAALLQGLPDGRRNAEVDPGPVLIAFLMRAQIDLADCSEVSALSPLDPPV